MLVHMRAANIVILYLRPVFMHRVHWNENDEFILHDRTVPLLDMGCVSIHNSVEFSFIHSSPAYSMFVCCLCESELFGVYVCICSTFVVYTRIVCALLYNWAN